MSRKARNDFVTKLLVDEERINSEKVKIFYSVILIRSLLRCLMMFKAREAL